MTGTKTDAPVTTFLVATTLALSQTLTERVLHQLSHISTKSNLELMTGIEPVTSPLPRECSTN